MSSFTEPLLVEELPNGLWRTKRELVYHIGEEGSGDVITVPIDFTTDFFSVPWPASMLIPKTQKGNAAAVLHDFLYSILGKTIVPFNMKKRTRAECDFIFKEAMKVLEMNWFKRGTIYNNVRTFGWIPWNHRARKLKIELSHAI